MTDSVQKHSWGTEITWTQRDSYYSRILVFETANSSTPMWISQQATCDWFVNSGSFSATWIDTRDGKIYNTALKEGDVFSVEPMKPVKLTVTSDSGSITEVGDQADDRVQLTEK